MRNEIILPADPSIFSDRFIYWNRFIFIGCRDMEMKRLVVHMCTTSDPHGLCFILFKKERHTPHLILCSYPYIRHWSGNIPQNKYRI
jgi:hypothetical protein